VISRPTLRALAALALILAPASPAGAQAGAPDSVDAYVRGEMAKRRIPGLQLAVVHHGRIAHLAAFGVANVQDAVPVTGSTRFTINSATKAFVGVAVMQLAERGRLDLDAPVSRYLDSLPASWQRVTTRQLLTHVSGLPNIMDNNTGELVAKGEAAARAKVQTMPLEFAPGEQYSYNQTNYLLIGRVIDKVSGVPFTRFIADEQLRAVGMPNTLDAGFRDSRDVIAHGARGYTFFRFTPEGMKRSDTLANVFEEFPPSLRTAAGMSSTAEELARWIIALQGGRLLKKESLATLWTSARLNNGSLAGFGGLLDGYGLGWPVSSRSEHRVVAAVGGARSAFFIYPDDDLAVVILTNLQGGFPESMMDDVARFYIPGFKVAKAER
jgi:CubicO group peptidase (beta-lactamase class C family)